MVLQTISLIFAHNKANLRTIAKYQEMLARQFWVVQQLRKHVSKEVFNDVQIESEVNKMDPDFKFYRAVFGEDPAPIEPLKL